MRGPSGDPQESVAVIRRSWGPQAEPPVLRGKMGRLMEGNSPESGQVRIGYFMAEPNV